MIPFGSELGAFQPSHSPWGFLLTKQGLLVKCSLQQVKCFFCLCLESTESARNYYISVSEQCAPSGTDRGLTESLILQVTKISLPGGELYESSARGGQGWKWIISVLSLAAESPRPKLVRWGECLTFRKHGCQWPPTLVRDLATVNPDTTGNTRWEPVSDSWPCRPQ